MAEFQELIKNFERIRDFMRQFYVYGFKVRNDYDRKSARTYDNERRRIESWLSAYTRSDYTAKGKKVYINVDSKAIPENPLYAAWKAKSFTDNDIMLHFFLLDQLWEASEGLSAGELGDRISECYGVAFDSQTVRLKLKEYEKLGILRGEKEGKALRYRLERDRSGSCQSGRRSGRNENESRGRQAGSSVGQTGKTDGTAGKTGGAAGKTNGQEEIERGQGAAAGATEPVDGGARADRAKNGQESKREGSLPSSVIEAVKFYQGSAPFGIIGSTLLDREGERNDHFQFKHHFIVHTLEDGVLLEVLSAMKEGRSISFLNKSSRSGRESYLKGLPLKIFVSTCTGRRYVCCYLEGPRRFINYRLDCIAQVKSEEACDTYEEKKQLLKKNLERCWGVSFGGRSRLEEICMKVYIDEAREPYILERLYREGRGGEILKVKEHEYLYSGAFFDTNEMLSWVKSFTGRVLDIQGSSLPAIAKVTEDWEKMYQMYCGGDNGAL